MAARASFVTGQSGQRQIIDLRRISAVDLNPLLEEEVSEWRAQLAWDFAPTAQLVRQYAGTNSLGGAALMIGGEVAGYGYAVVEEPRGIIGDLFVRQAWRTPEVEVDLFRSLLEALASTPRVTRMESQLMLASAEAAGRIGSAVQARNRGVALYDRLLLARSGAPVDIPARIDGFRFESWHERFMHVAAGIIAASYKGETDSDINAQYRSPGGARTFLGNIVNFPGCGTFRPESSYMVFDAGSNEPIGLVLTSVVLSGTAIGDSGHIAQLCVLPEWRGSGLGSSLLRMACQSLAARGAARVSLTVTAENRRAVSLYEKAGFQTVRKFCAYTWAA